MAEEEANSPDDILAGVGDDSSSGENAADAPEAPPAPAGPGKIGKILRTLYRWHPLIFLGVAAVLALAAWRVYPEPETRKIPPAEYFYFDGLDRLYRVINPDLSLVAGTPSDEALAARNAFLSLFVFHRENLRNYPNFINPHLLLAESNRILAEFNPAMADKYFGDASSAYSDALLWETRDDTPENQERYVRANFLGGRAETDPEADADEIALRRARREEYIRFRQAEADVNLQHPELARAALESIQRDFDGRRRDELRRSALEDFGRDNVPRHAFELGPDEYRLLDLLLAKVYDGLGQLDQARGWYLRYLGAVPGGRNHAFVVGRLAYISMGDGEVYRNVDPERAISSYRAAVEYYNELAASPSMTREQNKEAVEGLAKANSRLAELVPAGEATGVDELSAVGRAAKGWLEEFSGQPLPRRTLAIPMSVGRFLSKPDLILPGAATLPAVVGGQISDMAGGGMITPHEQRRRYLTLALGNFDRLAEIRQGTEEGDRARVDAAWESWNLGLRKETETRLERMIDPLSSDELILAARLGLATIALERGDLRRAHMLVLGGYAHPLPLWFVPTDADWRKIAVLLGNAANRQEPGVWRRIWDTLPVEGRDIAAYAASGRRLDDEYVNRFLRALNTMLRRSDFYQPASFPGMERNFYLSYILGRDPEMLTAEDVVWRNRLLLEEAWPYDLSQRAAKDNIGYTPFPPASEFPAGGLLNPDRVRRLLLDLARAWTRAANSTPDREDQFRMLSESIAAYNAALDGYAADPGDALYELARNYESLAEIREIQGNHLEALSLTGRAARAYLDVSLKAQGSPREMEALLASGDAFFRGGFLERTVESQRRFLERFGYASLPGTDGAMAVVRAENLLGRAYWFLNDTGHALDSFRSNIPRRTPDRYKSIYYIGRVLMEEGMFKNDSALLGDTADPLPNLDRQGDPIIQTTLQAFNFLRQSPGINPDARAWRWATFDLAKLHYVFADNARRAAQTPAAPAAPAAGAPPAAQAEEGEPEQAWIGRYDTARLHLTEALERYPLRRNSGYGLSVRVEPEDYADVMAARFETEYFLANTLLVLSDARQDEQLSALARAHLENLRDRTRYANALFDRTLDRFQLNSAVIREEIDGGAWDRTMPLPRTRLGDDEGPTRDPGQLRNMLVNSTILLANEYFRAGERASRRMRLASADPAAGGQPSDAAAAYYRDAYRTYQDLYDRFGAYYGPQAMVGMGDALNRMNYPEDAGNHYRMARNMVELLPPGSVPEGEVDLGPEFWARTAEQRLRDMEGGYTVP